jgi:hypothetical protein
MVIFRLFIDMGSSLIRIPAFPPVRNLKEKSLDKLETRAKLELFQLMVAVNQLNRGDEVIVLKIKNASPPRLFTAGK